jgi:DNA-binding GntR family transcriptional regulator
MVLRVAKIAPPAGGQLVRNASVVATDHIRNAIIEGRLAPGQRLKEEELARELGISRTPVREALLILQAEGLVDAVPNRGATVRAHGADDLDDLYQLRALLEGHAAHRAATRISEDDISLLRVSTERFEGLRGDADDLPELVKENMFFHYTIIAAAGSARLEGMVRRVIELPLVYRSYVYYSPEQKRVSAHYHRQIVNALAARDAERAQLIMKEHVYEARDLLIASLRAGEAAVVGEAL